MPFRKIEYWFSALSVVDLYAGFIFLIAGLLMGGAFVFEKLVLFFGAVFLSTCGVAVFRQKKAAVIAGLCYLPVFIFTSRYLFFFSHGIIFILCALYLSLHLACLYKIRQGRNLITSAVEPRRPHSFILASAVIYAVMGIENTLWFLIILDIHWSQADFERGRLDLILGTAFIGASILLLIQHYREKFRHVYWPYLLAATICLYIQRPWEWEHFAFINKAGTPQGWDYFLTFLLLHNSWISVGLLAGILIMKFKRRI